MTRPKSKFEMADITPHFGGILPHRKAGGDGLYYGLAATLGALAGWLDIKVGDLLLTAMVVLAACMLLGFLSPRRPWRWVVVVGIFVPAVEWLAYWFLSEKPERAQIYESFLAFVPGIAGAYGAAMGRGVVDNLFAKK
jgi:predicted MFS family arabinose efflux permease